MSYRTLKSGILSRIAQGNH